MSGKHIRAYRTDPATPFDVTMKLFGMLDSPYVRRVAISLRWLDLPFEHHALSVFRDFGPFAQVNPVVKAPTLVTGDGTVLMDSTLILQWVEPLASRRLTPAAPPERLRDLRLTGLALAACDKTVQMVYEQQLRPPQKQHQPWLDRVGGQLEAAYAALEAEISRVPVEADTASLTHGLIATAVAWSFTRQILPGRIPVASHAAISRYTDALEQQQPFRDFPPVDAAT